MFRTTVPLQEAFRFVEENEAEKKCHSLPVSQKDSKSASSQ